MEMRPRGKLARVAADGDGLAGAHAVADALGARGNELTVLPITPELVQRLAGDS